MRWAVEIQGTSLERRNLSDLLSGLGYSIIDGVDHIAVTSPSLDAHSSTGEVWIEAKKIREAMKGPANIDPQFTLGAVINYATGEPIRHLFLEAESGRFVVTGAATLTVAPPVGLSGEAHDAWKAARMESEYQVKLESQRARLEPVFREPRASKVLDLLERERHSGETLYKIYELVEEHPSQRKQLLRQFGVSQHEFDRFRDAVHNPVVSGEFARHAYHDQPRTNDPMTRGEAETFIVQLAHRWLASVR